ncbi:MAG TPA: hypothetical protein VGH28_25240 [Polyangiaceae bacterium]|jgi:MFS family permease
MRKLLLPLSAAAAFGCGPLVAKLGVVPGSAVLVALGVLLALAASGSFAALAIAAGALGAFAGHVLGSVAPAAGGAVLVALAFAERTTRVRGTNARVVHVGAAALVGALAGSLSTAYASASPAVRIVALLVCAVLVALPLLVDADDSLAASLEALSGGVTDPARSSLRDAAALRRQVRDVVLDDATRMTVAATWRALAKLAESRLRVERTKTLVGITSPAAAVSTRLDQRIADHVAALARAYAAADAAHVAEATLEDAALKDAESASESLEEHSRALVDVK